MRVFRANLTILTDIHVFMSISAKTLKFLQYNSFTRFEAKTCNSLDFMRFHTFLLVSHRKLQKCFVLPSLSLKRQICVFLRQKARFRWFFTFCIWCKKNKWVSHVYKKNTELCFFSVKSHDSWHFRRKLAKSSVF